MRTVSIGRAKVSGLCIGGNPFSGFSHQGEGRSRAMLDYYTPERIKQTLRLAEKLGVNTFFGRTDDHIMGILRDYWNEGGTLQWFAQFFDDKNDPDAWGKRLKAAVRLGATGAYLHGGVTDYWHANNLLDNFREAHAMMREAGVVTGFAGHRPDAHAWIRDHLDVDFQMCSYYNPTDRSQGSQHIATGEKWNEADREQMLQLIPTITKPVVHYKVFAAGNKPIRSAFEMLSRTVRQNDVVCIGVFLKDNPDMLAEDIALFRKYVDKVMLA